MMKRIRIQQSDGTQEAHIDAKMYLNDVMIILKLAEKPDWRTRYAWQKYRRELTSCSGGRILSAQGVSERHAKHNELVALVDDIFEKLPELPDEYQLQKLSKYIGELSECREQMLWH